jgi:3-isopropylmalate dehydrogenase
MKPSYHIAVLPGDGIGAEVMQAADQLLAAVQLRIGVRLDLNYQSAGAQHYLDTGVALPESTLKVCEAADAILFGAMGLPHVRGATAPKSFRNWTCAFTSTSMPVCDRSAPSWACLHR